MRVNDLYAEFGRLVVFIIALAIVAACGCLALNFLAFTLSQGGV